jgi:hypothetical protein
MKKCDAHDCDRKAQARGYCDKHYRRFLKYGSSEIRHIFVPKKCLEDSCDRQSKSKGYCDKHYRRFRKTGTPKLDKKYMSCSVSDCSERHVAKSFCATHYAMNRSNMIIDRQSKDLISNHNGQCDICKSKVPGFKRQKFCIDHDHKTGLVRGMLCQKCNIGLGNFNDNPDLLMEAVKYLNKKALSMV